MSEVANRLRQSAHHIEGAREEILHGDVDASTDSVEQMVEELDEILVDAQNVMRELAINEEIHEGVEGDDDE